jgi:uncharacterized protein YkwD
MTGLLLRAAAAVLLIFAMVQMSPAAPREDNENTKEAASQKATAPKAGALKSEKKTKARPAVRLSVKERRLVDAVNEYREKKGLEPLSVDAKLMGVARRAAPHFSHCINGKWCWHRAREAGFTGWATDDIANGYPTPEDAVQGWATSDGHARQMRGYFNMNGRWCNYKFNRIGVGVCGRKYIAVFGRENARRSRG